METLNKSIPIIASTFAFRREAESRGGKQPGMSAKSKASGSPRHFAPRDDGIAQCLFKRLGERVFSSRPFAPFADSFFPPR
jgi:hypothetical protein